VTGQDLIMGRRFITMFAASLVVVGLFVPVVHHLRSSSPAGPAGPPAGIPVPGPLTTSSTNYIGDPDIVAVPAAASPTGRAGYVLFSTSDYIANVPTEWSTDLRHWTQLPDALPDSPEWSDRRNANTKTWSPSVMFIDGRWVMYVTTRDFTAGRQCIAVAVAEHPAGPYRPVGAGPRGCQGRRRPARAGLEERRGRHQDPHIAVEPGTGPRRVVPRGRAEPPAAVGRTMGAGQHRGT
jgi:hypothetical protein